MEQFLRRADLAEKLGISETTLWRWVRSGHLPKPRQLGPNTVGWPESDVQEWVDRLHS